MSVAPDLPPVVRIPSRVTRTRPAAAPRRLRIVPPAVRPKGLPPPARAARPDARPARPETRLTSSATTAVRRCVDVEPIVPEAWTEPVLPQAADWDVFVDESFALSRGASGRTASPQRAETAAAVRLTRRGRAALAVAASVAAGVMVLLSVTGAGESTQPRPTTPASVVVADGDTLWTIAQRVAPGADPRHEVAVLMRINHLRAVDLVPGQVIRTR